jgi:predicted ATPase
LQGWALVERAALSGAREQGEAGLAQLREGLAVLQATEAEVYVPVFLGAVAQGYAQGGQAAEGLKVIAEALAMVEKNEERWLEAELYRIRGMLTLQSRTSLGQVPDKSQASQDQSEDTDPRSLTPDPQGEAEACFLQAIAIAQKQHAKSLELRAVMSLVRLRQQQAQDHAIRPTQHATHARLDEARTMLSAIYGWFTEGFDTKDLQEAHALLKKCEGP